ncbi:MAG: class I SAM-dependent methyltransferase [Anaerolineales bacterium]|nr:class I SAM-dependent methyltransferase [Anaerolineales bacterium]
MNPHPDPIQQQLSQLNPRRILDVATGRGGFIHTLVAYLPGFEEITGIDLTASAAQAFAQAFSDPRIRFQEMDATQLEFDDQHFDLVCLANSIHHFDRPERVLAEMLRVLRPGGTLLVLEMYRDRQSVTQLTHVELHHWWAEIDTGLGITHHETFTRQEVCAQLAKLPLANARHFDLSDLEPDSLDPETVQYLEKVIDLYQQRASELPEQARLQARGEELRQRVQQIGFHSATALLYLAEKPE